MRSQPTIFGRMGVIAYIAVGMAALRTNDELWAAVTLALTVTILGSATLVAIYRRGAWAGFAVFGWAQFLICQPYSAPSVGPASLSMGLVCRFLPYITTATNLVSPSFRLAGYPVIYSDDDGVFLSYLYAGSLTGSLTIPVHSLRAGLCFSSIVIGCLGSIVGVLIARYVNAECDKDESGSRARLRGKVIP